MLQSPHVLCMLDLVLLTDVLRSVLCFELNFQACVFLTCIGTVVSHKISAVRQIEALPRPLPVCKMVRAKAEVFFFMCHNPNQIKPLCTWKLSSEQGTPKRTWSCLIMNQTFWSIGVCIVYLDWLLFSRLWGRRLSHHLLPDLMGDSGDWTRELWHIKQMLYYWAVIPPQWPGW